MCHYMLFSCLIKEAPALVLPVFFTKIEMGGIIFWLFVLFPDKLAPPLRFVPHPLGCESFTLCQKDVNLVPSSDRPVASSIRKPTSIRCRGGLVETDGVKNL